MLDLWALLVEGLFGSFWISIAGLSMLFYIMFMVSKVSQATSLNFILVFIFALSIGYGYTAISILIWIGMILMSWIAIPKLINSAQSG